MPPDRLQTPVALFIFRRPHTTRRVFESIAQVKPLKLLVIADGARTSEEFVLCAEARSIVERVDWDCDVSLNYSDVNLGLKRRVSSGLDWVFEQVEEAIILEDDCLPDTSFFRFCEELLTCYRDDPRIMHISGNYFHTHLRFSESYYFSKYPHIWGWATWRRAWKYYDVTMESWNDIEIRRTFLEKFQTPRVRLYWNMILDQVKAGEINTWDFQWVFHCMLRGGLAINPTSNLVTNIGFSADATHTFKLEDMLANLPRQSITFPLKHPPEVELNVVATRQIEQLAFSAESLIAKVHRRLLKLLDGYKTFRHSMSNEHKES